MRRSASTPSPDDASTCRERRSDGAGESRMREICMSGLTSGNRRRSHVSPDCGGDAKAPPTSHRKANVTAPVLDSTHLDAAVVEEHDQAGPVPYRVSHGLRQ